MHTKLKNDRSTHDTPWNIIKIWKITVIISGFLKNLLVYIFQQRGAVNSHPFVLYNMIN